jgi:DNA polymerase-4/DNA polymerase V
MDIQKKNSYILHVDGDSFFASCEVSVRPNLRGKPVVVGRERSIVTALSYEAKALGLTRGMFVGDVSKKYPEVQILSSDYLLYKIFSARMFNILARYTEHVDLYSVDECFADITEVILQSQKDPMEACKELGRLIKYDLETELGMTFSIGIGPTKVLAKIGSKKEKPSGFVLVDNSNESINDFVKDMKVGSVWGIGPSGAKRLNDLRIESIQQLKDCDATFVHQHFDKHIKELWYELNGVSVMNVTYHASAESVSSGFGHASINRAESDSDQKSIQRTRMFPKLTSDRHEVYAELSSNVEAACQRARKANLVASSFSFFLKNKDFRYKSISCQLYKPTNIPQEILEQLSKHFDSIYNKGMVFRASGITLIGLKSTNNVQTGLFEENEKKGKKEQFEKLTKLTDLLENKFGEGIIQLASSKIKEKIPKKLYLPEIKIY